MYITVNMYIQVYILYIYIVSCSALYLLACVNNLNVLHALCIRIDNTAANKRLPVVYVCKQLLANNCQ